jgi:hypothetical protein
MVKIDPNQDLMLSKLSWPLALQLVNDAGDPIGLAHYDRYADQSDKREIYYNYGSKQLKLIVKNSTAKTDHKTP